MGNAEQAPHENPIAARSCDEYWYQLASIAAEMAGHRISDLEPVNGRWPSEEAMQLYSAYIDRGVAAFDILAPATELAGPTARALSAH